MRIVLLGPPGSGKGTQAILLAKEKKIPHISTGDIMRAAITARTPLGSKAKGYLDKGELVPDELVIDLIKERLKNSDAAAGYVLDGFPRTVEQAKALDALLGKLKSGLTHVVELVVPDEMLIQRIKNRGEQGSGRTDDKGDVAARRLEVYWEQTAPVTQFYESTARVITVDGVGTIEEVHARILKSLEQSLQK